MMPSTYTTSGSCSLGELDQDEAALQSRVGAGPERQDLDRQLGPSGRVRQRPQLAGPDVRVADLPPHHGLVQHTAKLRRGLPVQQRLLPREPRGDPAFDAFLVVTGADRTDDQPQGVMLRLQQPQGSARGNRAA